MVEEVIPNPSKKWGLAFAGATAGVLIIGAALGGVALSRQDEQNGNASSPPLYTKDLQDRGNQADAIAKSSYAFFTLGAILGVVDAVLWFEALRKPRTMKRPAGSVASTLSPSGLKF
jgi:hypothetical protein